MENKYVIPVRFSILKKREFFITNENNWTINERVLIQTNRGQELGLISGKAVPLKEISPFIIKEIYDKNLFIIRKSDNEDLKKHQKNLEKIKEVLPIIRNEIKNLKIKMRFLNAEYVLNAKKIIIFYKSEKKVNYRIIGKLLSKCLSYVNVEFCEIKNVKEEVKIINGIGSCGRFFCCSTFLEKNKNNFIKEKKTSKNNLKSFGICKKTKCCLSFEE